MKKLTIYLLLFPFFGLAQLDSTSSKFVINTGITFSMFQQQVKSEIGGVSGERLVDEKQFGYLFATLYKPYEWIGLGLYFRHDIGIREASQFSGFDKQSGTTTTTNQLGGNYNEIWVGPITSFFWKQFNIDIGFGAYGSRFDAGRNDLPSQTGSTIGNFTTHPTIAWLIAFGGNVPVNDNFDFTFKAEYRVRYYSQRNGENILSGIEHGTQSFYPIIGASYKF